MTLGKCRQSLCYKRVKLSQDYRYKCTVLLFFFSQMPHLSIWTASGQTNTHRIVTQSPKVTCLSVWLSPSLPCQSLFPLLFKHTHINITFPHAPLGSQFLCPISLWSLSSYSITITYPWTKHIITLIMCACYLCTHLFPPHFTNVDQQNCSVLSEL